LLVRPREPVRFPIAVGRNTTLRGQLAPGARGELQLKDTPKSPVGLKKNDSGAVPVLVSVTGNVLGEFTPTDPKFSDCGENTATAAVAPVPLKATGATETEGLVTTKSEPVRVPTAVGVKVTLTLHFAVGASAAGQLLV
jgi:hypothetical protein